MISYIATKLNKATAIIKLYTFHASGEFCKNDL